MSMKPWVIILLVALMSVCIAGLVVGLVLGLRDKKKLAVVKAKVNEICNKQLYEVCLRDSKTAGLTEDAAKLLCEKTTNASCVPLQTVLDGQFQ